jgi:hypothetical protein
VDEGEPVTCRSVMDQRFRGLAQDLVLAAQILNLALTATYFVTRLCEGSGEITAAQMTGHEPEPCRTLRRVWTALPNRAVPNGGSTSVP